ncbi:MAG: IPT/TIG domain-containing protein, partial [Chloroflexota bacterium]
MPRPDVRTRLIAFFGTVVVIMAGIGPVAAAARPTTQAESPSAAAVGPPAARADSLVTDEDTARSIDVLANDSGALDPASLTVTAPFHGGASVDQATGLVRYQPAPHYNGPDSFSYTVCDATAACASSSVGVTVQFFGRYRLIGSHSPLPGGGSLQTQLPDGTGKSEPIVSAFGQRTAMSPDGKWLAITGGDAVIFKWTATDDDRAFYALPTTDSPSWSATGAFLIVGSGPNIYRFAAPTPPTDIDPPLLKEPTQFTYDIPDGTGGTVTVPVLGYHPSWGERGVAFENWTEYVDPINVVDHIGIALVPDPGIAPAVLFEGSYHDPDWSSDGRLAVGCPGGLCVGAPNAAGEYTSLAPLPGNLPAQDPNDIRWSPDASKIAFSNMVVNADGSTANGSRVIRENRTDVNTTDLSWDTRPYSPPVAPWARDGQLAYQRGDRSGAARHGLQASNPDASGGRSIVDSADSRTVIAPVWSPDGRRIAFLAPDTSSSLYELEVMNGDGSGRARLAGDAYGEIAWSPDGQEILFSVSNCCAHGLFAIHPDGTGQRKISETGVRYPSYSPDGRFIVFQQGDGQTARVAYMRADGSAPPALLPGLGTSTSSEPAIARDGRLAFSSVYIYVAQMLWDPTPLAWSVHQITFDTRTPIKHSDMQPAWSPDGTALAYSRVDDPQAVGPDSFQRLYLVNDDGSRDTLIARSDTYEFTHPTWGPRPDATPPPTISAVTPSSGPTAGGTAVTISGTGFGGPGTTVSLGGVLATVSGGSTSSLSVTSPAHAAGAVDVVVTNPDSQTVTQAAAFTYADATPPPTISAVTPSSGPT